MTTRPSEADGPAVVPLAYAMAPNRRRRLTVALVTVALLAAAWMVAVLLPSLDRRPVHAPRLRCASNLRQIGQGVQIYAYEHKGAFPPDFATLLLLTEDLASEAFICPATDDTRAEGATTQAVATSLTMGAHHLSYVYTGNGLSVKSSADAVVAYEPLSNHGDGMNVLYADGHVQWLTARLGRRLMAELSAGHNPPRPEDGE
jgi:prepilin-type processing-associated H-X9-DG protein